MMKFYTAFSVAILVAAFQLTAQVSMERSASYFPIQDELNIEMISPNPVEKLCTVHFNHENTEGVTELRISNIIGKTIEVYTVDSKLSAYQMDLSEIHSGPYIISLYHNGSLKNSKRLFKK